MGPCCQYTLFTVDAALYSDELEAKMLWLKNFERVQEIQQQIQWQPITELEPRAFIPEVSICEVVILSGSSFVYRRPVSGGQCPECVAELTTNYKTFNIQTQQMFHSMSN